MSNTDTPDKLAAYVAGIKVGLSRFAWWKDGTQYVGTCGYTLASAISDVDSEFGIKTADTTGRREVASAASKTRAV